MSWNHILLVEDDDSLRLTQAMYLEREGFQVTAVGSGAEALRQIAVDQYQAIVTDLRLDEIDGLEVLATAKERSPETVGGNVVSSTIRNKPKNDKRS